VPVGAVVTDKAGQVLARAGNEVEARHDPHGNRPGRSPRRR
jgi:tRNA(Arg) A34 adenosine deaminase TadA